MRLPGDARTPDARAAGERSVGTMVTVAGGTFTIGSDDALAYPDDGEGRSRGRASGFRIDTCAVSNDRFAGSPKRAGT